MSEQLKKATDKRKVLEGYVVSDKMDKTIVVRVERKVKHPVYKKTVTHYKKFKVHDPENKAKIGNYVRIKESRPYSKEKKFRLIEVVR